MGIPVRVKLAAAGDGRTQRANIAAFSCYGIVPRMMVSPPERDLSIELFGKHLASPMFLAPIGLVGLCAPDFHGDVAAAEASAATVVPYTLSTFTQTRMEDVVRHAGQTPIFYQLYLPGDRELAASLINRAETSGYSALMVTVDSWTPGLLDSWTPGLLDSWTPGPWTPGLLDPRLPAHGS